MEALHLTYEVPGGDLTHAGEASSQVKQTLRRMGYDSDTIRRVSVCMYEGKSIWSSTLTADRRR